MVLMFYLIDGAVAMMGWDGCVAAEESGWKGRVWNYRFPTGR